ncbi:hypothetical protein JTE90_019227 [Oedothorax gibbosus]|uniref:Uncharacterized protein n=1 Tax=Oedothorax gibbosus TaxID=931172 RepID=A0AAV6URS3_9ARAC|nr:hypothetical protein JTE90_019227 [Oedothorax gibbosus]
MLSLDNYGLRKTNYPIHAKTNPITICQLCTIQCIEHQVKNGGRKVAPCPCSHVLASQVGAAEPLDNA